MTHYKKVTAIIRAKLLDCVESRLAAMGIDGITVTLVKGFGEWHPDHFFGYGKAIDRLVGHVRIEIFVDADIADAVCDAIAKAAYTGNAGDGVIASLPVEQFFHIRRHSQQN
ncbi:MAG: P-II family nitrogen regulator [Phycisphaeraceae bacterium]|nr:P-II family nitrogen regulator [Phycisphaeraceae bacterium]MCB9848809.1 P-II family nitrogen regulator [Phycisphaeraceae bacterium]